MLIALTGRPGAGKDSAAAAMCAGGYRSIAFADALRVEVAAAWGIDIRLLTERASKEQPTTYLAAGHAENANWLRWAAVNGISLLQARSPRWVLQRWGSFRRQHDPLHWVHHVTYWVQYQRQHGHANLVVTDLRLEHEAAALRALGARVLRVHRPGLPELLADTAEHESEQHTAISADADIHNAGTLPELAAEVWRVLQQLAAPQAQGQAAP